MGLYLLFMVVYCFELVVACLWLGLFGLVADGGFCLVLFVLWYVLLLSYLSLGGFVGCGFWVLGC